MSGCYDLLGNVFEFTTGIMASYPYTFDTHEKVDIGQRRVIRGGVFRGQENRPQVRITYREDFEPHEGRIDIGFRAILGPSMQSHLFTHVKFRKQHYGPLS